MPLVVTPPSPLLESPPLGTFQEEVPKRDGASGRTTSGMVLQDAPLLCMNTWLRDATNWGFRRYPGWGPSDVLLEIRGEVPPLDWVPQTCFLPCGP